VRRKELTVEAKVAEVLAQYEVVLNVGSKQGIEPGWLVTVWRTVDVKDPGSDVVIGRVRRPKIRMRVTEVQAQVAVAESIEFYSTASGLDAFLTTSRPSRERRRVSKTVPAGGVILEQVAVVSIGDEATLVAPPPPESTKPAG
jgi:hypothetical protein